MLVLMLMAVAPSGARGARVTTIEIGPGVTFTKIYDPKGPWRIRVVSAELTAPSTIEPVLATGKLPGFERTSSMATRYGALAAINGDYARPSGRPVMTFAQDGEMAQTSLTRGVNFAVNESETAAYIQHQKPEMWLEDDSGFRRSVATFNAGWPRDRQISAYSALGGRDERPPAGACSARLYATEGPRESTTDIAIEQNHVVNAVACKSEGRLWPRRGRVFSTPMTSARTPEITSLTPGQSVRFAWSLGWPDVFETIGGNPTLVRNGEIFIERTGYGGFFNRHPRTGVGTTPDGRVLFVTVDGRQAGYSIGMTPWRFAKLFVSLGANYALNLDGGGSTTMVVEGDIVNRPSDGYERPVSSSLLLLPGPDPAPTASPAPVPTTSPSPTPSPTPSMSALPVIGDGPPPWLTARQVWLAIAQDPASTGGLMQWWLHEGVRLSPPLRKAARIFGAR